MSYSISILSNEEFDNLPLEVTKGATINDSLGFADPRTGKAYIRHTGIRELNTYLVDHELDELVASESSHEDEFGIRHQKFKGFGNALASGAKAIGGAAKTGVGALGRGAATVGKAVGGPLLAGGQQIGSSLLNFGQKAGAGAGSLLSQFTQLGSPQGATGLPLLLDGRCSSFNGECPQLDVDHLEFRLVGSGAVRGLSDAPQRPST